MEDTEKQTLTQLHAAVASYKMPEKAKQLIGSGEVTVLCGVSAAGKNTIADYLVERGTYAHVVSHTTRPPRENGGVLEQNGKEYWFISNEEMLSLIQQEQFVEVKSIHGQQVSGTSISSIETIMQNGNHPVMEIDIQGTIELTNIVPNLRPLFVLPPSYEVWMERLGTRGALSDGEKERRIRSASMEIETALEHSAFVLIVNHEVDQTSAEIIRGVDSSEQTQAYRRKLAEELLEAARRS